MNHPMFCYQCEQTAGCSGCVGKAGVCGKSAAVANLRDQLTGALIGLARAADTNAPTASTHRAVIEIRPSQALELSYSLTHLGVRTRNCPLINTKIPVEKRSKTVKFSQSGSN